MATELDFGALCGPLLGEIERKGHRGCKEHRNKNRGRIMGSEVEGCPLWLKHERMRGTYKSTGVWGAVREELI